MSQTTETQRRAVPAASLDADAVRAAYRRWAAIYDAAFGGVSAWGRRRAVAEANRLPGRSVLEVGVGTGLALPHYRPDKRITGIDLSAEMLQRARAARAARGACATSTALLEMDAEATGFPAASFDIAVAMFVASVVPDPRRLLAEMRRVVRPGGHILFVNHFAAAARAALVGGTRAGAGLARARLASRFRTGGAAARRSSAPAPGCIRCRRSACSPWCVWRIEGVSRKRSVFNGLYREWS